MDFSLTEAQQDLAALARRMLTDRVTTERLREIESKDDRFDRSLWSELAGAGVLAAALPDSVGGAGYGLLEQCSVLIELGRTVAPVPYLPSIVMGADAIARFGSAEQRDRWAAPAARGELVLTAALSSSDGDQPHAERVDDRWVLTGAMTAVPALPHADLVLVPATAAEGTAVFAIEPADGGVTIERQHVVNGDPEGWLRLDGVTLGDDRLLGDAEVLKWLVARGTVGLCALQLGVTERALELTAAYAGSRVQFGRTIGSFQAVTQRLADAYIDVEAIRLTMWQAAWRLANELPCGTEIGTAKFWAADAGHRVAHTAVHIHGGVGIDLDAEPHRYFAAAKHHEFSLGGGTAHLRAIGAALAQREIA